ncbi:MAG: ABC transporter permease [Chloroflexota bacterium]
MTVRYSTPLGSAGLLLLMLAAWWLASWRIFVVPSPPSTIGALVADLADPQYIQHLAATAEGSAAAFVLSIVVGVALGLTLGLIEPVREALQPLLVALNGVPKIVLYPILLLLFGMALGSKIAMGAVFGIFPVMLNLSAGLSDLPAIYKRLGRSLRASRWQMFVHIYLPAALGPFLTGVRLAFSLSVVGVVLSEMLATRLGLGRVIESSYSLGRYAEMSASIVLLLAASLVGSLTLWYFERRVTA